MKLTLALPSLNRFADESVPALALPAFNHLCVTAYYAKKHSGRLNFTAAICGTAASLPKCNVYAT